MTPQEIRAYLQSIIGQPTDNPLELHWRALLVTQLREWEVWPCC